MFGWRTSAWIKVCIWGAVREWSRFESPINAIFAVHVGPVLLCALTKLVPREQDQQISLGSPKGYGHFRFALFSIAHFYSN